MMNKLIIGTANFGLRYGIANDKKLNPDEAFAVLDRAHDMGVQGIDTARAYGDAENVVGQFFARRGKVFSVITKLPGREYSTVKEVEAEVFLSLKNLNISFIDVFLVHSFDTYKQYGHIIIPALQALREDRIIGDYGVSVYHPWEVAEIAGRNNDKGRDAMAFEFPLNLFDQRFLKDTTMQKLKNRGCLLFVRSIFLQGLFFLSDDALQGRFGPVRGKVREIRELSMKHNIRPECAALLFAALKPWVDGVVVGIDSIEQLMNNSECFRPENRVSYAALEPSLSELAVDDEEIILPYKWRSAGNA